MDKNGGYYIVYAASNKTSCVYFEDKGDAEKYQSACGASVGIQITEILIIPKTIVRSYVSWNTRYQKEIAELKAREKEACNE